ncbi:DUF2004 domain-containing protein [Chryseobacterium sp. NKUCC03_KSP]|uniref:DUF2004 domain-containing protein n=1 Tax=Chryseobacterium TaxID=59732 RepID=UPI001C5A9F0B|nr:DUF2004 domain-containing protein [Chryseobacterium sp. NKUCC03_KSP]MBW3524369.1 DUF2004 domain-containing protein [Chryseobacterium sp. NKUCC03_KSP]
MKEYTLQHFGTLSTKNLEEYYVVNIEFEGDEIEIDLNFEKKTIDTITMDKVKNFIENIEKYDKLNKTCILTDYNNEDGDIVKSYLEHHLEEVQKDALSNLITFDDNTTEPELQLLKNLKLVRVGLYPDNEDNFAIFDYSIGVEITNYVIVIYTDENGQLDYMTMES